MNSKNLNNFNMLHKRWRCVCATDLHLYDQFHPLSRKFIKLIDKLFELKPDYFVLLGDVFDFYFGDSNYFRVKYAWFYECMVKLSKNGTKIIFVEGNHEFALNKTNWDHIQLFTPSFNAPFLFINDLNIAVTHGDLFAAPRKYKIFRKLVKSQSLHFICKFIPGSVLDRYARFHSSFSRTRSEYRNLDHEKILQDAQDMADVYVPQSQVVLFGHFHYPFNINRNERLYLSLHSWHKPSVLLFNNPNDYKVEFLNDE